MEQTKVEIPGPIQLSEENQALSVQPKKLKETGESSIEMIDSPKTAYSLKNATKEIGTSNMSGQVNGGMGNNNSTSESSIEMNATKEIGTNNMAAKVKGGMGNNNSTNHYHLHVHRKQDVSEAMAALFGRGSDTNFTVACDDSEKLDGLPMSRTRRISLTEVSLGTRREVATTTSTVMEDQEENPQISVLTPAALPNKENEFEGYVKNDDVDGNDRCLKEGVKLEVGTATPETDQQTDTNKSTGTCSSSEVLVRSPESTVLPEYSCTPSVDKGSPISQEMASSNPGTSTSPTNVENSYREGGRSTSPQPIFSPSDDTNPWSKSSKKGPGNTVAEKPDGNYSPNKTQTEEGGSLTSFSLLFEPLKDINPIHTMWVKIIFNQLIIHAENLPKITMIQISEYLFDCLKSATINPREDESVPGNFKSLTDFKELEKKLRKLDNFIPNVDVPVILDIARLGPQMLPEIVKHLNAYRAATPVAVSTVSAVPTAAVSVAAATDAAAAATDAVSAATVSVAATDAAAIVLLMLMMLLLMLMMLTTTMMMSGLLFQKT